MTREQVIKANYEAQISVVEAERANIRTQIALLEANLKQNAARTQEIEYSYHEFVNSLSAQPQIEQKASKK